jgi:mannose-6-phosphate isomerase-like protein (cupin superfamily)
MIERIVHGGLEFALILRAATPTEGIRFHTQSDASLQIGQMLRPKGYLIRPHVHVPVPRTVSYTQEVLFIRSGHVRVDFYDEQQQYCESCELWPGDVVLLARGGHGFRMLEPSEIVEVKQGPYVGENDKVRFDGINDNDALSKGSGK